MDMHPRCHSERSEESSSLFEQPPYQGKREQGDRLPGKVYLLYSGDIIGDRFALLRLLGVFGL